MITSLEAVRVQDIILDQNHPRYFGEDSIGTILWTFLDEYPPVNPNTGVNDFSQLPSAKPLYYNISHYPVANEIVHIVGAPSRTYNENADTNTYYLPPISLHKSANNNSLPNALDKNNNFKQGEYFKEKSNINPLQPYEGDIMIEGRYGNSIRFGSTIDNTRVVNPNRWSNEGEIGDPITIIRNGQAEDTSIEGFQHITENVNEDNSSIYLCSNQQLSGFRPASLHQESFGGNLELSSEEEIIRNNDNLEENPQEDIIMTTPNNLVASELQDTELNNFDADSDDAYYDIASTEDQIIFPNNPLNDIPDDLPDSIDFNQTLG